MEAMICSLKELAATPETFTQALADSVNLYTANERVAATVRTSEYTMIGALERNLERRKVSVAAIHGGVSKKACAGQLLDFITATLAEEYDPQPSAAGSSSAKPIFSASSSSNAGSSIHFVTEKPDEEDSRSRSQHCQDARAVCANPAASRALLEIA